MKYENISIYINDEFKQQIETLFPSVKEGKMSIAAAIKLAVAKLYKTEKDKIKD